MSDPISTMLLKEHQIQFVNAKVNAWYLSSEYLLTFKRRWICILRILELLRKCRKMSFDLCLYNLSRQSANIWSKVLGNAKIFLYYLNCKLFVISKVVFARIFRTDMVSFFIYCQIQVFIVLYALDLDEFSPSFLTLIYCFKPWLTWWTYESPYHIGIHI